MTVATRLTDDGKSAVIELTTAELLNLNIWLLNQGFIRPGTTACDLRAAVSELVRTFAKEPKR